MRVYLPGWVSCFCDVLIFLFLIFCDVLTSLAPIILPSSLQQDSWSEPNIWLWVSVSASFRYCLKAIWRQWDIYQSDHKRWTVQAMCLLLLAILGGVIFVYSCEFPLHQVSSWKKKSLPFPIISFSILPFHSTLTRFLKFLSHTASSSPRRSIQFPFPWIANHSPPC